LRAEYDVMDWILDSESKKKIGKRVDFCVEILEFISK
jgi:hypothetical protein